MRDGSVVRSISSCHRSRRVFFCQSGCLRYYSHLLFKRQKLQGDIRFILVRSDHVQLVTLGKAADKRSCYNAFSRLDMRVQVTIPGSVESYCIDERGDKRVATDALWLETYLCTVLRAYSYADDGGGESIRKIMGCRRFNPITNTEAEHRFFDAAEQLFFQG